MQELPRYQIDPPSAEKVRELSLQLEDSESKNRSRFEIDQQINVAVGPEIFPQSRTKDRELANPPAPADFRQALGIDVRSQTVHRFTHEKSVTQMPDPGF